MATSARLEELKTRFDENPRRYFAPLANEHRKMGDLAHAIDICRAHLPAQPGHVSGHIVLAQALHESGQVDEAQQEFEAALELDPENLIALRFMGDIARGRGDVDAARAWYERVLDADPRNDEVSGFLRELNEAPRQSASFEPPAPTTHGPRLTPMILPTLGESTDSASPDTPPSTTEVRSGDQVPDFVPGSGTFAATHDASLPADARESRAADEPADAPPAAQEDRAAALGQGFFSTGAGEFGASGVDAGDNAVDEARPPEPAPADHASLGTDIVAQHGDSDALEIEPFDMLTAGTEAPSEQDAALPWQAPGHEAREDAVEEIDFETVWSPDATLEEAVPETPDSQDAVPGSSSMAPGDATDYDAYWKSHTPASVEYSDLAAVPEDWFTDNPPAAGEPPAAHEAPIEPGEVGSSGSDEIDSWFAAEPAASESREVAEAQAPDATRASEQKPADFDEEDSFWNVEPARSEERATEAQPVTDASEDEHEPLAADASAEPDTWSAYDAWGAGQGPAAVVAPGEEPLQEHAPAARHDEPAEPIGSEAGHEPVASEPVADEPVTSEPVAEWGSQVPAEARVEDGETPQAPQRPVEEPGPRPAMNVPRETGTDPFATEEPAAAPFVTETLAELYLQQGFREEAIAIYRRLVDRSPFDKRLREKLDALEASAAEAADAEAMHADASAAGSKPEGEAEGPAGPLAGTTVREFFSSLARREPFTRGPSGGGSGTSAGYADAGRASGSTGDPSSPAPVDFAPRRGASPGEYPESNSALAQMFGAADPSTTDAAAATSLATAFDVGHGAPPPQGRPSRVSDRELSLDHLFREPGSEQGGAVSMDEFYSSGAKPDAADAPDEGSRADERDPDITQFSAWLEGLKKK